MLHQVDHRRLAALVLGVVLSRLMADDGPQLLDVDRRAVLLQAGLLHVEVPHAHLTEVTRVAEVWWW